MAASVTPAKSDHHLTAPEPIFLVVNPLSGGRRGECFLEVPKPLEVELGLGRRAHLWVYSVLDGETPHKPGFIALKKTISSGAAPVRLIVAGGDGSIARMLDDAEKHGIDAAQLYIGIMPLGTGNDFARAAGWGGSNPSASVLENDCQQLCDMVRRWCAGVPLKHDVWQVQIAVDELQGSIHHKERATQELVMDIPMVNYFSIGQDAEVGYDFEQNRRSSQFYNNLQYAMSGAKMSCNCELITQRRTRVHEVVRGCYNGTSDQGPAIFVTEDDEGPRLRRSPKILLVLNIKSYSGGFAPYLWRKSSLRLGVDQPLDRHLLGRKSHPGDGRLEVVTLKRAARVLTSGLMGCRRVFWGAPLFLDFHESEDDNTVVYCNIDGEFYKLTNPISLSITLKQKINVLHDPDNSMVNCEEFAEQPDSESESEDSSSEEDEPGWYATHC